MAQTVEKLQITGITSQALTAYRATNKLAGMVNTLSTSLNGIDTSVLAGFASSVEDISYSMQGMNTLTYEVTTGLNESNDTIEDTTKNAFSLSSAIGKMAQSIPNVKAIIDKFVQAIPNMKETFQEMYGAVANTETFISSFEHYTDTFENIASKWDDDFETYGSENAKHYTNTFIKQMNGELSKLSGVTIDLSVDMESGTLVESGTKNLGIDVQDVTHFAAEIATLVDSMKMTGDVTLVSASAFVKLAGDMSSAFGIDYSTIAGELQNALLGQSDALLKYDVNLSDATLQLYAYKYGVGKAVSEMTQAEKTQLSMVAIIDQTRGSWGGLAKSINSPTTMFKQFANRCKEVVIILGQLFTPVLSAILPIMNGITIAIKDFMGNIAGLLGITMDIDIQSSGTSSVVETLEASTEGFEGATSAAKEYQNQILGFDEITVMQPLDTNSASNSTSNTSSSSGTFDLSNEVLNAVSEYENVWNKAYTNMGNEAQKFADKFAGAFQSIEKVVQDFAVGDYFQAGKDVGNLVISLNTFLANVISSVDWFSIGQMIGNFLAGINWTEVLSSIGNLLWTAITAAIEVHNGLFDAAPVEMGVIAGVTLLSWAGVGSLISSSLAKVIAANLGVEIAKDAGIGTALKTGLLENCQKTFSTAKTNVGILFENFFSGLSLNDSFKAAFGITGIQVLGIVGIVGGAFLSVTNFITMLQEGFSWLNEILMLVEIGIAAVSAILFGIPATTVAIVAGIVAAVGTLVVVIHDNWDAIVAWTSALFTNVSGFFIQLWTSIEETWIGVSTWFDETVIQPITGFFEGFSTRVEQVMEGLNIFIQAIWMLLAPWFDMTVVQPLINLFSPAVEALSGMFEFLWNSVESIWNSFASWLDQTIITPMTNNVEQFCNFISGVVSALWSGLKSGGANAMNAVIEGIESGINFIINGVNKIIKGFNQVVSWAAYITGADWDGVDTISTVKLSRISVYATGGFPEDGWFRASHGEIMGRFDNGQSVVANNMQITNGIANAVYPAVYDAMMSALSQNGNNGNVVVQIDGREVFRTVRKQANNYTRQTGQPAFNY